jgi:hypothetical protein
LTGESSNSLDFRVVPGTFLRFAANVRTLLHTEGNPLEMHVDPGSKSAVRPYWLIVATFLVMLIGSWNRWTSLIVDIGRETDLPLRLMNGEVLYRDVHFIYPPLGPYFNAALYYIFGPHLNTLIFSGIASSAILTFLCYRVARRFMTEWTASIAVSFIVVLCFFKPAGNLILSYSFSGVYAAIFGLGAVLALVRFADTRRRRELIAAGLCIGLAAISKPEFAFAAAVAAGAYLLFLHRKNFRPFPADLGITAASSLAVAIPVFGLLFATLDARMLIEDCHLFYTHLPASLVYYNKFRSGLDHPAASVAAMAGALALTAAIASVIAFASDRSGTIRKTAAAIFAGSAAVAGSILYFQIEDWDGSPLRAVPILLAAAIIFEWRRRTRDEDAAESSKHHAIFIVAVYSLVMLSRVVLRVPSGGFSGSFYLPPALLLGFYWLLEALPRFIGNRAGDASGVRAARIAATAAMIAVLAAGVSFIVRFHRKYDFPIEARRGRLYGERFSAPAIAEALNFIEENTSLGETIGVMPEGSDLAFLTGRRIDQRHQVMIPDFMSEQDELNAIAALERDGVRYIFVPNRAMREFGKTEFGTDFYQKLGVWINANFALERTFGVKDGQPAVTGEAPFWIKVYKRK